jgi:hypothetical protein
MSIWAKLWEPIGGAILGACVGLVAGLFGVPLLYHLWVLMNDPSQISDGQYWMSVFYLGVLSAMYGVPLGIAIGAIAGVLWRGSRPRRRA